MRLQLIARALLASAILVTLVPEAARGDDAFVAKTQVYTDSDHTTVVSPLVAISRDTWEGGTLGASYVADVVSSASIDVVSNATKEMHDFRSEITGGLTQKLKATTLSASYIYSVEHDYSSHNIDVGIAQDLFQKNTNLALGYSLSLNDVGRSGDQSFHRSLMTNGIGLTWTQVFNRATIGQASYTFSFDDGYQASPYRFVSILSPDLSGIEFKVPETDPLSRYRHAFVLGLNRHLFTDSSIQGDYRLYFDSWGIVAHTVQLRYFVTFKDVTLRFRGRFYYQKGADFFRSHYTSDALQPFVTADRELSTFWSTIVGAKVSWRLPWVHRALALEAKADLFYFNYIDFSLLAYRVGANLEAGLSVAY
ncbi:MAG: DUF3570 domain-containing protein [Polyangia bacterium]